MWTHGKDGEKIKIHVIVTYTTAKNIDLNSCHTEVQLKINCSDDAVSLPVKVLYGNDGSIQ